MPHGMLDWLLGTFQKDSKHVIAYMLLQLWYKRSEHKNYNKTLSPIAQHVF